MKLGFVVFSTLAICSLNSESNAQDGFVLKTGEGEPVLSGIVIKVSPDVGSDGSILFEQTFPNGGKTSLHAHDQGDEIIYVVSGRGQARIDNETQSIGAGDVIFVPSGHTHQISNLENEEPLRAVVFMNSPELIEELRAIQERISSQPDKPITREEFSRIVEQVGGSRLVNE